MKTKILLGIFGAIFTTMAFAESGICVKPTTSMIVLDPNVNGSGSSNNAATKTWSVTFTYGVVSGIAGCIDTTDTATVPGDEVQSTLSTTTTGGRCYCKMLYPVSSRWVFAYNASAYCAQYCTSNCSAEYTLKNQTFRQNLFGSITRNY